VFVRFGSVRFGSFVCVCVRLVVGSPSRRLARSLSIASACPLPPPLLLVPPPTRACVQCRSQHGRFATLVRHPYAGKYPGFAGHRCHGSMSRSWLACVRAARCLVLIAAALVWPIGWSRDPLQTNRGGSQVDAGVWQLLQESVAGRDRVLARTLQGRAGRLQEEGEEHHGREGVRCSLPLSTRAPSPASECHTRQRASSHAFDARAGVRASLSAKGDNVARVGAQTSPHSLSRALELTALSRVSQNGQGRVGCDSPRARQASAEAPRL